LKEKAKPVNFIPCRFTNFTAKSADATAKSSFARRIGKIPNVRIAARRNCPRNFPRSPLPPLAEIPAAEKTAAAIVAAADAVATELTIDAPCVISELTRQS